VDSRDLVAGEALKQLREVGDPPLAAALHDATSLRSGVEALHAAVPRIALTPDESLLFERLDDARHRRRPHLLGRRELAERARPAEDEHRESGELSRRHTGRRILPADVPQGMDRSGVEAVRRLD